MDYPLHEFLAREAPTLSPGARLAFMHVSSSLAATGWVPSTGELANMLGITPRQTRRYLAELHASGNYPRSAFKWLASVPVEDRLAAAMPLAAAYFEMENQDAPQDSIA